MIDEKQLLKFFKRTQKDLKENFEARYGITDKKRAIDRLISVFPNGLEIFVSNIRSIKDSTSSMIIKYDPNNLDAPFKYHGFYDVNDVHELEYVILDIFGIQWHLEINENTLSVSSSEDKQSYFYIKNESSMIESISKFFEFHISQNIMGAFELSVEGINDKIHSITLKDTQEKYKKILELPNDKSLVIFDLPFKMVLENDRYDFIHKNKMGEIRLVTLTALYGDGRPPLMGLRTGLPFSRVIIIYPFEKATCEDDEVLIYAINIMNEIIEAFRIVTNYYFIPNLSINDIKEYRIFIQGKGSIMAAKIRDSYSPYFKYENQIKKEDYSPLFAKYLKGDEPISLYITLLSNSKRHFYYQNYQYAIFESVIALETVIYRFLENNYRELNISKNKINKFLVDIGLTNAISVAIIPFISQENKDEFAKLLSECKGAITLRNKIAHEGLRDFEIEEVANYIKSIERLIDIIVNSN
ncbi:MAG: hypothetical protein KAT66_10455 [Candidatus Lokiarchaeota archaeon]|nr:hypothetical protein [Candidatus Lokiarchaeota archaeon]